MKAMKIGALVSALAVVPQLLGGTSTEVVDGVTWTYSLSGTDAYVGNTGWMGTAIDAGTMGAVVVPSSFHNGDYPVVGIAAYAFASCSKMTSITIPEGVKTIGGQSFPGCIALRSVSFPSTLTSIGGMAFEGCCSIESVSLPSNVTTIETMAFGGCTNLSSVTLSDKLSVIGDGAFGGCYKIPAVTIPASVTEIGSGAFAAYDSGFMSYTKENPDLSVTFEGVPPTTVGQKPFPTGAKGYYRQENSSAWEADGVIVDGKWCGLVMARLTSEINLSGCTDLVEYVVPADSILSECSDCWALKRVVFSDEKMLDWRYHDSLLQVCAMSDAIYYPRQSAAKWGKVLKNLGYGGDYGSYSGTWSGVGCLDCVATPSGFVNVITEIKGGSSVAVPESWTGNYPKFEETYGSNFASAVIRPTGKLAADGSALLVWHDYVAGTDPTDKNSKFTATISFVGGKPVVKWSPELSAEEAAKRVYKVHGKAKLTDTWNEVDGDEASYNFFKVTVEMQQ